MTTKTTERVRITVDLYGEDGAGVTKYTFWPEQWLLQIDSRTIDVTTDESTCREFWQGPHHVLLAAHGDGSTMRRQKATE